MSKKIEELDISYYETAWETVCGELQAKINELIEVVNVQQKQIQVLGKMNNNLHDRLKEIDSKPKNID